MCFGYDDLDVPPDKAAGMRHLGLSVVNKSDDHVQPNYEQFNHTDA